MMPAPPFAAMFIVGAGLTPITIYIGAIVAFFLSIVWRPQIGVYFLVPLLPLQTVRYLLHPLPYGEKLVDFVLLGIIVGLFIHRKGRIFPQSSLNAFLIVWAGLLYLSLWQGAFYLGRGFPLWFTDDRLSNYKNYMIMPLIFFVVAAAIKDKRQMKILLALMFLSILRANLGFYNTVSDRDFTHFSYDVRYAGVFGYAGENGLGAFEAQFVLFCIALYAFAKSKLEKLALVGFIATCVYCILFAFSRGAYLGFVFGLLFLGIIKERKLLLFLMILIVGWQTLVPTAVSERIFTTYEDGQIESSAGERVTIWEDAATIIPQHLVVGTGFDTYEFMGRIGEFRDTHNFYLKILVETGIAGLLLFLILFWKIFRMSFRLYRAARDPFLQALGLGTAAYIFCSFVVNIFGDRWMYLQVNGYLWTMLGLVARAHLLSQEEGAAETASEPAEYSSGPLTLAPESPALPHA